MQKVLTPVLVHYDNDRRATLQHLLGKHVIEHCERDGAPLDPSQLKAVKTGVKKFWELFRSALGQGFTAETTSMRGILASIQGAKSSRKRGRGEEEGRGLWRVMQSGIPTFGPEKFLRRKI